MPDQLPPPDGADTSQPFELHYFAPDPDLTDMVSSFYFARLDMPLFDEYERADRPQFRIMTKPDGEYVFPGGHRFPAARATIIGPTSGSVRAIARGPTALYGFGIMPAGWAALMGDEAEKLTDRAIDAADLFGGWIDDAVGALIEATSVEDRLVIANNIVREIMKPGEPAPLWFIRTVDKWLTESASPQVPELVEATGMSIRSVERMTKHYYGLSPRMLARKYRAVRAASALARGEDLASAKLGDAFYDQSHLIREIKRFAGATPGQLARPSRYTEATAKGRKNLAGKVSPIVSDT
ncbi:helix-turn-helix domain-containing protein [Sphingopyxis sp. XHP0097]|jgi:AraC-like DNA-binding protein|uniref:Helix-turn-helix domain-containing protein n=1 Tax=Sphingopyxis jiangsuensis TaxID=2871171 RepID=A0ABS7MA68_9SPHN|nr:MULTISPECIES: helix-turn-helix domain-containing protein [Sphingopyxis]MBL0768370.1 AraC family transcriptional regulator [Sphingopyxis lutea]MBY4635915.1 helix-turn-helix domain-containing protein [Sphingopyxis jiangsuensis]